MFSEERSPMPNAPKIDRAHVISWLSGPRYGKYLEVTRGDDAVALDLYLWNIGLAQAVLKDVSFFEVALRNAYDRAYPPLGAGPTTGCSTTPPP